MENTVQDLLKLKNTLLQLNGSLLKIGLNKDDIVILLPDGDFSYISNALSTSNSGLAKFYLAVDNNEFMLSGLKIRRYFKEL